MNLNTLCDIIEHAYLTVPLYRNKFDISTHLSELQKDPVGFLQTLPIIQKDEVRQHSSESISDLFVTNLDSRKIITKSTSGSTGKCLYVYWSMRDDILTNYEAWKYRQQWYGITSKDKYATFHTTMYVGNRFIADKKFVIENDRHISFNKIMLTKSTCNEYLKKIQDFGASVLLTQPSTIEFLIRASNNESLSVLQGLKYIELIGEYCSPKFREYVKRMLPNVLVSNMYGTTEMGYVALTCQYGHQHILGNTFVEVLDSNNIPTSKEGRLILTSLKNHVMPFVRYNIGDRGLIKPSKCECGFTGYDLIITQGRESDYISIPENDEKSAYTLWYSIEKINSEFGNPIITYHFIQKEKDLIIAYLSIKEEFLPWFNAIEDSLIKSLKSDVCDKISYRVSLVEYSYENTRKMKFFENQISNL